jgi:hypothetical protein
MWRFSPGNSSRETPARVGRTLAPHDSVSVADEEQNLRRVRERCEVDLILRVAESCREDAQDRIGHRKVLLAGDSSVLDGEAASTRIADHEHGQSVEIDALCRRANPVCDELHRLGFVVHLVARVEHDAPAGDEMRNPREVVLRRRLGRAALAVEVDDEVLRSTGRAVDPDARGTLADRPLGGTQSLLALAAATAE